MAGRLEGKRAVVTAAGVPIGVTTCWEVIFDRAARAAVLNGAQVLAVPTNNATFDAGVSARTTQPFYRLLASDIVPIAIISLLLAFVATLYPSWRASRVQPAQALRYE